jgi:hypothetical protein
MRDLQGKSGDGGNRTRATFLLTVDGRRTRLDQADIPRLMTLVDMLSRMAHTVPLVIEPEEC